MKKLHWIFLSLLLLSFAETMTAGENGAVSPQLQKPTILCPSSSANCADISSRLQEALGQYSGHDEPGLGFYSHRPGSGANLRTTLTLPNDPPTPPRQDGTGGTFNFQLHAAFWFSMVLCDTQSSPNFTHVCVPNSDANIFDNPDPNAPDFLGHHPGSAFLELQFYPPGGLNTCSDPTHWCVSMVIFSFNFQDLTNTPNNADCSARVGLEPGNFAFLTTNGISQFLADPLSFDPNPLFATVPGQIFLMNPGDKLDVSIHDTPEGLRASIHDLTTGVSGSMTAGIANGFTQVNFVPDPDPAHPSVTCTSTPYAFHPQFSTSGEHTRAEWTAHTLNVGFADEIGHFHLCSAVNREGGRCIGATPTDPGPESDARGSCFSGPFLALFGLQPIGACIRSDFDFDGTPYQLTWPGTGNAATDALLRPEPIRFTSPRFLARGENDEDDSARRLHEFSRVAFETDTPISEFLTNPACDLLSPTGTGCTNPPAGTQFYPIFSTTRSHEHDDDGGVCSWQLGGPNIPGAENNFGGTATKEYGAALPVFFALPIDATHPKGDSIGVISDFRRILPHNPCAHGEDDDQGNDR